MLACLFLPNGTNNDCFMPLIGIVFTLVAGFTPPQRAGAEKIHLIDASLKKYRLLVFHYENAAQ